MDLLSTLYSITKGGKLLGVRSLYKYLKLKVLIFTVHTVHIINRQNCMNFHMYYMYMLYIFKYSHPTLFFKIPSSDNMNIFIFAAMPIPGN